MKLILPGIPISKARPKFNRRGTYLQSYDPQKKIKDSIKNQIRSFVHTRIYEDVEFARDFSQLCHSSAIIVRLDFFFPLLSTKNLSPWFFDEHIFKPDIDNISKWILDILSKEFFDDDKQIVELISKKSFSQKPRTEITIMPKKKIPLHDKIKSVLNVFDPTSVQEFYEDVETLQMLVHGVDFENLENVKPEWLSSAACFLSHFSHKYSDKINKVKKMGDLSKEMENYEKIEKEKL